MLTIRPGSDAGWADALGCVVVDEESDEFEIRLAPDRLPGLLFVPVSDVKAAKDRLHPDFRPTDHHAGSSV